jgi:hypothetical protein
MGNDARRFWKALARDGRAPATWGKIDTGSWAHFLTYMYVRHPELRLCEGDWKIHFWCTTHYPGWHKHHVNPSSAGVKRWDSPCSDDDGDHGTQIEPPAKRARTGERVPCLSFVKSSSSCRVAPSLREESTDVYVHHQSSLQSY